MCSDSLKNFAKYVLTDEKLKDLLTEDDYKKFKTIKHNNEIDINFFDRVAKAIQKWAISLGVTYYSHWFFPLNGKTTEKRISFFMRKNGTVIDQNIRQHLAIIDKTIYDIM